MGSQTKFNYTVMGDAVNVASRLQQVAPLDGVLVSHDTFRHVRGVFDVQEGEPVQVRGRTAPVKVYRVLGAKRRPEQPAHYVPAYLRAHGYRITPVGVENEIELDRPKAEQVFEPEAVNNLVSILVDVVEKGTGRSARLEGRQVAGKTGTTDQVRDIWFVGFTPELLAVVWVGFGWGTDVFRARQVIAERLGRVELPAQASRPELGPVSSIMGGPPWRRRGRANGWFRCRAGRRRPASSLPDLSRPR